MMDKEEIFNSIHDISKPVRIKTILEILFHLIQLMDENNLTNGERKILAMLLEDLLTLNMVSNIKNDSL